MTDEDVPEAHRAIQSGKLGKMSGKDVLDRVVAGKPWIPMSNVPEIENGKVTGRDPPLLTLADGSRWLAAFTTNALATTFCEQDKDYGFCMTVDTPWVLRALPPDCGIGFNMNTGDMLKWSAAGLAKYRQDVLGW